MKILISRPDKIGDVILALHAVKQLKELMPQAQIYMHLADYTAEMVKNVRFIDGVVFLDEDLRPHRFDAVVDLMAKFRTARLYFPAGIPIRIGNSARWFRWLYNRTKYVRRSRTLMNEAEYNWELLSLLDESLKNLPLKTGLALSDFREIIPFTEFERYSVIMPSLGVSAEPWAPEQWIRLTELLSEEDPDRQVVLLLGPAEEGLRSQYAGKLSHLPNVCFRILPDLRQVLGLLQRAEFYVGLSSGITHLASAIGVPGVGLYPELRSMSPKRWKPFRSSLQILSPIRQITAQDVFQALNSSLDHEFLTKFSEDHRRSRISAFVVCMNEEKNIRRCLESIKWCDELLIVDSGSQDRTLEICREYTNRIIERPWPGHREQKQFALEQCRHEWILNIDADEEVSTELKGHILRVLSMPEEKQVAVNGYFLCRVVYFFKRWWDRGGWHPEYRMRLFRKQFTRWGGVNPHEKAIVDGPTRKLPGAIYHYTFSGIVDLIETLNRFSTNSARAMYQQGLRSNIRKILFRPPFRFIKFYILKQGYREGTVGFIVACSEAFYTFLKYAKLWELGKFSKPIELAEKLPSAAVVDHLAAQPEAESLSVVQNTR